MNSVYFICFLVLEVYSRQCGPLPNDIYIPKGEKRELHFWTNGEDVRESLVVSQSQKEKPSEDVTAEPVEDFTESFDDAAVDHSVTSKVDLISGETKHDAPPENLMPKESIFGSNNLGNQAPEVPPSDLPVVIDEVKIPDGPVQIHAVEASSIEILPVPAEPEQKGESSVQIVAAVIEDDHMDNTENGQITEANNLSNYESDPSQQQIGIINPKAPVDETSHNDDPLPIKLDDSNQIEPERVIDMFPTANNMNVVSNSKDLADSVNGQEEFVNPVITVSNDITEAHDTLSVSSTQSSDVTEYDTPETGLHQLISSSVDLNSVPPSDDLGHSDYPSKGLGQQIKKLQTKQELFVDDMLIEVHKIDSLTLPLRVSEASHAPFHMKTDTTGLDKVMGNIPQDRHPLFQNVLDDTRVNTEVSEVAIVQQNNDFGAGYQDLENTSETNIEVGPLVNDVTEVQEPASETNTEVSLLVDDVNEVQEPAMLQPVSQVVSSDPSSETSIAPLSKLQTIIRDKFPHGVIVGNDVPHGSVIVELPHSTLAKDDLPHESLAVDDSSPHESTMSNPRIVKDNPALDLTVVAKDNLPLRPLLDGDSFPLDSPLTIIPESAVVKDNLAHSSSIAKDDLPHESLVAPLESTMISNPTMVKDTLLHEFAVVKDGLPQESNAVDILPHKSAVQHGLPHESMVSDSLPDRSSDRSSMLISSTAVKDDSPRGSAVQDGLPQQSMVADSAPDKSTMISVKDDFSHYSTLDKDDIPHEASHVKFGGSEIKDVVSNEPAAVSNSPGGVLIIKEDDSVDEDSTSIAMSDFEAVSGDKDETQMAESTTPWDMTADETKMAESTTPGDMTDDDSATEAVTTLQKKEHSVAEGDMPVTSVAEVSADSAAVHLMPSGQEPLRIVPEIDSMIVIDEELSEVIGSNGTDIFQNDYETVQGMATDPMDDHIVDLDHTEPFTGVDVQTESSLAALVEEEKESKFINPLNFIKPSRFDEDIGTTENDVIDVTERSTFDEGSGELPQFEGSDLDADARDQIVDLMLVAQPGELSETESVLLQREIFPVSSFVDQSSSDALNKVQGVPQETLSSQVVDKLIVNQAQQQAIVESERDKVEDLEQITEPSTEPSQTEELLLQQDVFADQSPVLHSSSDALPSKDELQHELFNSSINREAMPNDLKETPAPVSKIDQENDFIASSAGDVPALSKQTSDDDKILNSAMDREAMANVSEEKAASDSKNNQENDFLPEVSKQASDSDETLPIDEKNQQRDPEPLLDTPTELPGSSGSEEVMSAFDHTIRNGSGDKDHSPGTTETPTLVPETPTEQMTTRGTEKSSTAASSSKPEPVEEASSEAPRPIVVSESPWERRPGDSPLPSVLQSLFSFLGGGRRQDSIREPSGSKFFIANQPSKMQRQGVETPISKRFLEIPPERNVLQETSTETFEKTTREPSTTGSRVLSMNGPSAIIRPHSNLGLNAEELQRLKMRTKTQSSRTWSTFDEENSQARHINEDIKSEDGMKGSKLFEFLKSQPLPLQHAILRGLPQASKANATTVVRQKRSSFSEETIECDWKIRTDPGLYILVTFHNISAPYSVDCHGAYIEVERESNGYEARWCGDRVMTGGGRPHVIFARREIRITVFESGAEEKRAKLPTGFSAEVEVVDLFDAVQYMDFKRSAAYSSVRRLSG